MRTESNLNPRLFLLFPLMLIPLIFSPSCNKEIDSPSESALLSIDLVSDFQTDTLQVELDDQVLLSGTVTYDYSLSLAWQKQIIVTPGSHFVQIFILNRGAHGDTIVSLQDTLTVAVGYDRGENKVIFTLYDFLIPYR